MGRDAEVPTKIVAAVRRICLALPEAYEEPAWWAPAGACAPARSPA